jgi:hypothetical protein
METPETCRPWLHSVSSFCARETSTIIAGGVWVAWSVERNYGWVRRVGARGACVVDPILGKGVGRREVGAKDIMFLA